MLRHNFPKCQVQINVMSTEFNLEAISFISFKTAFEFPLERTGKRKKKQPQISMTNSVFIQMAMSPRYIVIIKIKPNDIFNNKEKSCFFFFFQ